MRFITILALILGVILGGISGSVFKPQSYEVHIMHDGGSGPIYSTHDRQKFAMIKNILEDRSVAYLLTIDGWLESQTEGGIFNSCNFPSGFKFRVRKKKENKI